MRKILIKLVIVVALIVTMSILWLWRGRDLSLLVDRFGPMETSSRPIKTITYEGNGTGGILHVNDVALGLNESELQGTQPNVGTTKDNELALSLGGKVFPFGPAASGTENLAAATPADDDARVSIQHSALSWPTFFDFNFMIGKSPSWRRHQYYRVDWKKPNGTKLEMVWRYEQYFYPGDGWTSALMTREGSTGLIRVDISSAAR